MQTIKKRNHTSNTLILYIILFSSLITFIITLTQLYFEYKNEITTLNTNIANIKTGYRQGITNAVWLDDKRQLTAILKGINALSYIEYIEVRIDDQLYAFSGQHVQQNIIKSSFPLHYEYNNQQLTIGETLFEADLSGIYAHLRNRIWIILASNAIKTFLVALFMYFIFNRLVFRRLNMIFNFVQNHDIHNLTDRIDLKKINNHHQSDEISEIATSLNKMQEQLFLSINELLQLKTTLNLSLDGIAMFHPDTYNFFYTNNGAVKLLGYSAKELMTMTPFDICPEFSNKYFHKQIKQTIDNPEHANILETTFTHKNGNSIPVKLTLQYLKPENEEARFIFIARDITKRKEDEVTLLKLLEDVKEASKAKSNFMMSMSHEFRTPLNAILGFSQLLELNSDTLSPDQLIAVKDIHQAGKHLLLLVEDILDLTSIESNSLTLSYKLIVPTDIVADCFTIVSSMAKEKNIQLVNKTISTSLPKINVDPTRFKQILLNLLSNAIKYNKQGGSVTLTYELLPSQNIRFKISDTGLGINESDKVNIFTPFNRLGYEAGKIEGTGIGLNITKQLVELMNGKIDFQSSAEEGTVFWVDFPYEIQIKT